MLSIFYVYCSHCKNPSKESARGRSFFVFCAFWRKRSLGSHENCRGRLQSLVGGMRWKSRLQGGRALPPMETTAPAPQVPEEPSAAGTEIPKEGTQVSDRKPRLCKLSHLSKTLGCQFDRVAKLHAECSFSRPPSNSSCEAVGLSLVSSLLLCYVRSHLWPRKNNTPTSLLQW